MIAFLNVFQLRMRMNWSGVNSSTNFIKWSAHFGYWGLLLTMRILSSHDASFFVLGKNKCTSPSSRIIRPAVSHLCLRSSLGNCRWKPVLSKQVMPSSLSLAWCNYYVYLFLLLLAEWLVWVKSFLVPVTHERFLVVSITNLLHVRHSICITYRYYFISILINFMVAPIC